jgi:CRISPR system Cascade subunit CasB
MPPDGEKRRLGDIVASISAVMQRKLDAGALARLRRMDVDGPGEADFWRLAGECGFIEEVNGNKWLRLVKIMALLTSRGEPATRSGPHSSERPLGAVLCDGGRRNGHEERPFLSETRLARFLALPFERRGVALEGMARTLAGRREQDAGVNCVDIACLLFSQDVTHGRRLASAYYRRLDSTRNTSQEDNAA